MQQLWSIDKPITQHVSGSIVPIFRSVRLYNTAYGFQHSKRSQNKVFVLWSIVCCFKWILEHMPQDNTQNTPYSLSNTGYQPSLNTTNNRSQYKQLMLTYLLQCWKPYAVVYSLALLKMGTMVPEICWVIGLSINHNCCIKLVYYMQ
jgi:hypothetical protein